MELTLRPIGFLRSCYPEKFGVPRQPGLVSQAWGELRILPEWQPEAALQGVEEFSHLWLLFSFHRNKNEGYRPKVHPPRLGGASLGVFATRSPHRPNPLGLSLVKLERVQGSVLFLSGVDLVEGTPIYDIKPYLPEVEAQSQARQGWTGSADSVRASVEWSPAARAGLEEWLRFDSKNASDRDLRVLIEDTVALDPRPLVYRGFEGGESRYRQIHAVRIEGGDVRFQFIEPKRAVILEVLRHYSGNE